MAKRLLNYLAFPSFYYELACRTKVIPVTCRVHFKYCFFEHIWWRLFQKRVVCITFDIYICIAKTDRSYFKAPYTLIRLQISEPLDVKYITILRNWQHLLYDDKLTGMQLNSYSQQYIKMNFILCNKIEWKTKKYHTVGLRTL